MSPAPTDTEKAPQATNGTAHAAATDLVRAPAPAKGPQPYEQGTRIYRGRSVEELIPRIEAELGADAIVLRRRSGLAGGVAGFFQTPFVEIEARPGHPRLDLYDGAAAEPHDQALTSETPRLAPPASVDRPADASPAELPAGGEDTLAQLHAKYGRVAAPPSAATPAGGSFADALVRAANNGTAAFDAAAAQPQAEVYTSVPQAQPQAEAYTPIPHAQPQAEAYTPVPQAQPRAEVYTPVPHAHTQAAAYSSAATPPPDRDPAQALVPRTAATGEPPPAAPVSQPRARGAVQTKLRARGIEHELADELIATAAAHELPLMPARTTLATAVQAVLRRRIPSAAPLPAKGSAVAFVGPGGAGKTSCCAALLRAYAKRSDTPVACASVTDADPDPTVVLWPKLAQPTPLSDRRAERELARARADGLLLLDMPAIAPGERRSIQSLAALLSRLPVDRVVLALPAPFGAAAAAQLLEAARPLRATSLAITHADSTDQLGVAVEAACRFGLAPEFLFESRRGGTLQRTDPDELAERMLA